MENEKRYRITWVIDVFGISPLAAVKKAREIQLNPDSIATVFDAYCYEEKRLGTHTIDLWIEKESEDAK